MTPELHTALTGIYHLQAIALVLTAGLFGYAIYATVTLARILRDVRERREGGA
jgi:high-affinity Fe2+/Pb2+ permease